MTLERLVFQSGQKPLISAEGMASFSPAEDNLLNQGECPLLISIPGVTDRDTETKQKGRGGSRSSLRNFLPHDS